MRSSFLVASDFCRRSLKTTDDFDRTHCSPLAVDEVHRQGMVLAVRLQKSLKLWRCVQEDGADALRCKVFATNKKLATPLWSEEKKGYVPDRLFDNRHKVLLEVYDVGYVC